MDGRYDVELRELAADPDEERAPAGGHRPPRAGGRRARRRPSPVDRVRGRMLGAVRRPCARRVPDARRGGHARPLAPVPGDLGLRRGRRAAGAGRSCAHFGDRLAPVRPRGRAATSATRPARCRAATAAAAPAGDRPACPATSTPRSSPGRRPRDPACGRTRVVEILRGGRSRKLLEHSYDGLPAYGTFDHLTAARGARPRRRADQRRAPALDRRAPTRSSGAARRGRGVRVGVLASGAGTNLQALLDTVHGHEAEVVAVASDKPEARALERAAGARGPDARVRARGLPRPRGTRRGDGGLAGRARASSSWCWPGYMQLLDAGLPGAIPRPRAQRAPAAAAGVSRASTPIDQALAYGVKVAGVTVHLVDEGVDTGPILLQAAVGRRRT